MFRCCVQRSSDVVLRSQSRSVSTIARNGLLRQQQQLIGTTSESALVGDGTGYPISVRTLSTNAAAVKVRLPPNLKIDPRSSFAPPRKFDAPKVPAKKETTKDDDVKADSGAKVSPDSDIQDREEDEEEDDLDYDSDDDLDFGMLQDENTAPLYAIPLPERLKVNIYTIFAPEHSNEVGTLHLDAATFGRDPIRTDMLKRAVDYYRAKKRGRRQAVTKTISEVSGSGRKVRNQKGGGIARAGHSRPAHWRGGAKAHGPKNNTDYGNVKLNKKVRKQALQHALSQKLLEGNLIVLDQLHALPSHKTKDLADMLAPWDIAGRYGTTALILDHYYPDKSDSDDNKEATSYRGIPVNLWVASGNLFKIKVGNDHLASVYDILKYDKLVLTLSALQQLEQRLKDV
jgi:large subunit ribosomal protein L4